MTRFALAASVASVLVLLGAGVAVAAPIPSGSIPTVMAAQTSTSESPYAAAPDAEAPTDVKFSLASPGPFAPGDTITVNWSARDSSPIAHVELDFRGGNGNLQSLRLDTSRSSQDGIQHGTATAVVNVRTWETDTYTLWAYSFADEHWNVTSECTGPLDGCNAPVDFPELSFAVTQIEVDAEAPQLRVLTMTTPERVRPNETVSFDWEVSDSVGVRFLMLIFEKPRVDLDCDPIESPCSELIVHTVSNRSSDGTTHRGSISEIVDEGFSWQTGTYTLKQVYAEDFDKNVTRLRDGDPTFPSVAFTVTHKAPSPTETTSPSPTETTSPSPTETTSPSPTETTSPSPTETTSPSPTETTSPSATVPSVQPTSTAGSPIVDPADGATHTHVTSYSPTASTSPNDSALPVVPASSGDGVADGSASPVLAATGGELALPAVGAALLLLTGAGALLASRKIRGDIELR